MNKVIKLSGSFERSHAVADAMETLEAAIAHLREFTDSGDYGSAEYFEALKAKKAAEAAHSQAIRNLRS